MTSPLLDVRSLSVSFASQKDRTSIIENLSFQVHEGETLCIVGESGSGKTVALMSMLGLLDPLSSHVEGRAMYKGEDMLRAPPRRVRRIRGRDIALISQDPMTALTPVHTVGWQIAEQLRAHTSLSRRAARARVIELLGEVGIPRPGLTADQYPHQLSGGMRQRAVIAMALSCNPSLLIADEPTTALDVTVQAQVLDLLRRLRRDFGTSIVLITHDMGVVAEMADRVLVMYGGRIVEQGPTDAVFSNAWHPYTWGLLDSIPPLEGPRPKRLLSISGSPPQPDRRPSGCIFRPRCRAQMADCVSVPPLQGAENRTALCFIDEGARKAARAASSQNLGAICMNANPHGLVANPVLKPLLRVENLVKSFALRKSVFSGSGHRVSAVDDVSFEVFPGETLGLVGESGCGKSTLGRCLVRLYQASSGRIMLEGTDLVPLNQRQLRPLRTKMQMIFQDPAASLNPRRRVGDLIAEPLRVHKMADEAGIARQLRELMDMVGLPASALDRYPHEFSGGQRQRIGIARALALKPKLIVADEPVSALDVSVQAQIVNLFEDLREQLQLTILFIAHDLSVVRQVSERTAVMYLGSIVEIGETDLLFRKPAHHYTRALLSAIPLPRVGASERSGRILLKGEIPSSTNPPTGCRFHTRCAAAAERCRIERPALMRISDGRKVACHFPIQS